MIVCIDGSGSMAGDKEVWAKAVALALLEIARKQRRAFTTIVFSSGQADLHVFDLLERPHRGALESPPVDLRHLMEFAECFPRAGTNFQVPLEHASGLLLEQSKFRRGDIVFITDGEAHLPEPWLHEFEQLKKALEFRVHGILVDVGPNNRSTAVLEAFADRVTPVTRLAAEQLEGLFGAI